MVGAVAVLGTLGVLGYVQNQTDAHPNIPTPDMQVNAQLEPQAVGVSSFRSDVQRELDVCFRCHGEGGVSLRPAYPTIAGQKPDYIRRQLQVFRHTGNDPSDEVLYRNETGDQFDAFRSKLPHRNNVAMDGMAKSVPSALLDSVVKALSSLPCDGGKPKVITEIRPSLPTKTNRCVVCHGQNGISLEPNTPNLAGQHQVYLRRELIMIRDSARGLIPDANAPSRSHPTMEAQAEHLTDSDIDEISGYFAALDCRGGL
ncbi:hypothetical protein BEN30_04385 [Magnetovibrio blakemorei]|uniref:Cytochrome c domain-containing protein n=1 Tax=Magnetovibrio blakemorei TaxID=28181 RepID=A0A1E5QBB4_9PROT|nr:hypothetical protein BEN30_04385 [Magnetovibrio blakemorei]